MRPPLRAAAVAAVLLAAACSPPPPEVAPEPAPVVAPASPPVPEGSDLCYLTVAQAVKDPRLEVEQVAAPRKMDPPLFKAPYPRGVFGKGNTMELEFEVLVDTLGKADMTTFTVLKASNAWFGTQAKKAVPKWSFTPAVKAGCKVSRYYKLGVSYPPKTPK